MSRIRVSRYFFFAALAVAMMIPVSASAGVGFGIGFYGPIYPWGYGYYPYGPYYGPYPAIPRVRIRLSQPPRGRGAHQEP